MPERQDMLRFSWDEVQTLWKELPQRNWVAFAEMLTERRGKNDGIDEQLADRLISYSEGMEWDGHDFPGSARELYEMLNERLVGESPEEFKEE